MRQDETPPLMNYGKIVSVAEATEKAKALGATGGAGEGGAGLGLV